MNLSIEKDVRNIFPEISTLAFEVRDVEVKKESRELEDFKREVFEKVRVEKLEELKNNRIFRAYRDFFWKIKIDPTKIRPASEALIRRILLGKSIPKINTLVDAYNLASVETKIAIGAFDMEKIKGSLKMRFAKQGETFRGIGMEKDIILKGREVVIEDGEKIIAIYPYRDSDETKITLETKNAVILTCGVPGIEEGLLKEAGERAVHHIERFCKE